MNPQRRQKIFSDWLATHRGLLFKIVRAYTLSSHDSDDLFQEISIQLWKSIPSFKAQSSETTWIYRVAFFTASTWSQKEMRRRQSREKVAKELPILSQGEAQADPRLEWLYDQIHQMDEPDRTLTLLLLDGFRYEEMSNITGLTLSNVGVRINRIKKRLTHSLESEIQP